MYMHTNKEMFFYFLELPVETKKIIFDIGSESVNYIGDCSSLPTALLPSALLHTLPNGRYEVLGSAYRLLGQQWEEIVDEPDSCSYFGIPLYTNYLFPGDWNHTFTNPRDSGLSLLESVGLKPDTFIIKKK